MLVFGYPKVGTLLMQQAPTLAIDVPLMALVWQDEQDQVWLTYNSSEYMRSVIYPRHGLTVSADAQEHGAGAQRGQRSRHQVERAAPTEDSGVKYIRTSNFRPTSVCLLTTPMPNIGVQPTPYSVRSAPASRRG
jgi:hypothetical protein